MSALFQSFEELLKDVQTKYDQLKSENKYLRERLNSYNQEEEIKNRDEKIKTLYKNSLYQMTDKEFKDRNEFTEIHLEKHKPLHPMKNYGISFEYALTGTGLGTLIKVKCPVCGEEKDITDTSVW